MQKNFGIKTWLFLFLKSFGYFFKKLVLVKEFKLMCHWSVLLLKNHPKCIVIDMLVFPWSALVLKSYLMET